jgi:hypothetical protein
LTSEHTFEYHGFSVPVLPRNGIASWNRISRAPSH